MNQSPEVKDLFSALAKAQLVITDATKDAKNPHFRNDYATLASVLEAVREPLSKNGLSVVQGPQASEGGLVLVTVLAHASGQWIRSETPLMLVKQDMQGLGSALTYARRYALASICGVSQVDDDAEASVNRPHTPNLKITAKEMDAQLGPRVKAPSKVLVKPVDANEPPKAPTTRAELNKRIVELYSLYLKKFPETKIDQLLFSRYEVGETRLMTLEQCEHFANMMEEQIKEQL